MLYLVATPIGNLKDITYRAIEVLNEVDVIACEDTRNSLTLLKHYNINKKLIAYHKFNEETSGNGIIKLLKEGKSVAVISDCGMPLISDPGAKLVSKLIENNLEYTIIPGPSASLSALVLSGFASDKFTFLGFLPEKIKQKEELLSEVKNYKTSLIFYVSPHNLTEDLNVFFKILGKRKACLVKEITKIYETKCFFTLGQLPEIEIKGEFVLIIEQNKDENPLKNLSIEQQIEYFLQSGLTHKEALKKVAKLNNIKNKYKMQ